MNKHSRWPTTVAKRQGLDLTRPNVARIYDYFLGGKDNFAPDREVAEGALAIAPELRTMARENRALLTRIVLFLARNGIRRFIDIGCGLPTQGNVHEIAQSIAPNSRVVYVDNDPVVVVHAEALLGKADNVKIVTGDVLDPDGILGAPEVQSLLADGEPVAVLLLAILHVIPDEAATRIVATLRDAMPSGSYLAISHVANDSRPDRADRVAAVLRQAAEPVWRNQTQVINLFDGFQLLAPGVVYAPEWRPVGRVLLEPDRDAWILGGVGRKP